MPLLKRTPVYIKISVNNIEVTNLSTGKTLSKISPVAFSTSRIVIANFNVIEALLRDMLKEIIEKKIFPVQLKVLIQQTQEVDGELTEIEKRTLRDLAELAGATHVEIVDHFRKLSDQDAAMRLSHSN